VFAGVYGTNALVNQYAAQLVATIKANQKVCTCGLALSIFKFEVGMPSVFELTSGRSRL